MNWRLASASTPLLPFTYPGSEDSANTLSSTSPGASVSSEVVELSSITSSAGLRSSSS